VDINSTGSRKPVRKKAIGTSIAPGIPHVPGIGINSPYPDSGGVRHSYVPPCEGINSRSFRSNRKSSTPKRSPHRANLGIGGWIMPGFGV